ncbi:MAG: VanZ family protein [Actinomycetota bacterium]|nr:VanZ family protein [Actinomycetota bacterium]
MVRFTSVRERRLWIWALTVTAAIYATLGQAPAVAGALRDRDLLDNAFFTAFLVVVAALTVVGLAVRPGWREVAVVVAVLSAYLMAFLRFTNPAERTHLVEFGVVAVLVYLALYERRSNGASVRAPAVVAFVTAAVLGFVDEGIQAILPNRFYDLIDVAFNTGAALMAIAAVASLRWARTRRNTSSAGSA